MMNFKTIVGCTFTIMWSFSLILITNYTEMVVHPPSKCVVENVQLYEALLTNDTKAIKTVFM